MALQFYVRTYYVVLISFKCSIQECEKLQWACICKSCISQKKLCPLFTGDNLLGTEARLRRIKSANNRFITTSKRPHRDDDDDSSSSTISIERNQRYRPLFNDPEERLANYVEIEGQKTSMETIKSETNGSILLKPPDKIQKRRPKTAKNR